MPTKTNTPTDPSMTQQTADAAPALYQQPDAPMTPPDPMQILAGAIQSGKSPAELSEFMDFVERWQKNEAASKFADKLAAFQNECPQIRKSRQINLGGGQGPLYASLDDIMQQIQPLLAKHGLSVTFTAAITQDGLLRAVCKVRSGTHVEENEITLPVPSAMKVNATQQMGAAMSYAKRYALCAALNIVVTDEDRDAAHLHETVTEQQAQQLRELAESVGGDTVKNFLQWADGAETFEQVPAHRYQQGLAGLQAKLKRGAS